jgi:transcriptional regulator with XRE-family HTH domain
MIGADIVVRLRDLRRFRDISQKRLARLSGVGEKTISSFETGARIESMKLTQLRAILSALCVGTAEFFADDFEETLSAASDMKRRRGPDAYARQVLEVLRAARRDGHSTQEIIAVVLAIADAQRAASPLRRVS